MLRDFKDGLREAIYFVWVALRALKFWRRDPPILSPADLAKFVETRAKYVSQRTLFGYVKTRAGTRYAQLFEDSTFVASVDAAKWEIYFACLADLAIFATAAVGRGVPLEAEKLCELAKYIYQSGLDSEDVPAQRPEGYGDDIERFATRVGEISWPDVRPDETEFAPSLEALVYWAPVADELKKYDTVPVRNSMRFQWKTVRDQLSTLLDAGAVADGLNPVSKPDAHARDPQSI